MSTMTNVDKKHVNGGQNKCRQGQHRQHNNTNHKHKTNINTQKKHMSIMTTKRIDK